MSKTYLFISGHGTSGAPRRFMNLARSWVDQGKQAKLVCYKGHGIASLASRDGLDCIEYSLFKRQEGSKGIRKLLTLILNLTFLQFWLLLNFIPKLNDNDVVILRSTLSGLYFLPIYLLKPCKVILDLDCETRGNVLIDFFRKISIINADKIVKQYAGVLKSQLPNELNAKMMSKSQTILPGINISEITDSVKKELFLPFNSSTSISILHLAKIHPRKNQLFTLKVLKALNNLGVKNNISLTLCGGIADSDYSGEVMDYISRFGLQDQITLLEWSSTPLSLINSADLLIVPSLEEGVPNTIQEAQIIGIPVAAFSCGGIPDILLDDKGLIFDDFNVERWSSSIYRFLSDRKKRGDVITNARRFALQEYDIDIFAQRYEKVIDD